MGASDFWHAQRGPCLTSGRHSRHPIINYDYLSSFWREEITDCSFEESLLGGRSQHTLLTLWLRGGLKVKNRHLNATRIKIHPCVTTVVFLKWWEASLESQSLRPSPRCSFVLNVVATGTHPKIKVFKMYWVMFNFLSHCSSPTYVLHISCRLHHRVIILQFWNLFINLLLSPQLWCSREEGLLCLYYHLYNQTTDDLIFKIPDCMSDLCYWFSGRTV